MHSTSPTTSTTSHDPYYDLHTQDALLAAVLTTCFVVGLVGNISALLYFRVNKRDSLPDKIYTAIAAVDIVTNITSIPLISFLFNDRDTALCKNLVINWGVVILSHFTVCMSIFLVAVLSVTRTISIVRPHRYREIRNLNVNLVFVGYASFLFLIYVTLGVFHELGWLKPANPARRESCTVLTRTAKTPNQVIIYLQVASVVEILLPSVTVFISFIVGVVALRRMRQRTPSNTNNTNNVRRFHQVSITITLFTALFLLCYLPFVAYYSLLIVGYHVPSVSDKLERLMYESRDKWFVWSSGILFQDLPIYLNATLNPCLYLLRMPRYRQQFSRATRNVFMAVSAPRDTASTSRVRNGDRAELQPLSPYGSEVRVR